MLKGLMMIERHQSIINLSYEINCSDITIDNNVRIQKMI